MRSARAPVFDELEELQVHLKKANPERTVLANGCFDLVHVGHIRYLREAKQLGDFLLVALNDDSSTRLIKGSPRPIIPQDERAGILSSLEMVDAVLIFSQENVVPILETVRPHCHAKGTDYTVDSVPERETSRKLGIRIAITGDPKDHASSTLIDRLRSGGLTDND